MGIMGSALQWVMMGGFWDLPSPVFDNVWVQSLPRTHTHILARKERVRQLVFLEPTRLDAGALGLHLGCDMVIGCISPSISWHTLVQSLVLKGGGWPIHCFQPPIHTVHSKPRFAISFD